ncbi:anthranilate synthase component I [Vallitalea okinawensis]|uniref:anthranilate synthase component I n=1 Tax=Vallitalea okinawensis TaxID=2078660 RepID=UPI000CFACADD|nr:anthranilate synthase component I [Vallitalea okinawensis]
MLKPYILTLSSDMETPITLYQKYVRNEQGFLLESKETGTGRYSIIGKSPFMTFKSRRSKIIIEKEGCIYFEEGSPLEILKKYINAYKIENDTELPFVGGAVGTVGYDVVRQYEKLPDFNNESLELPEIHQMFVKEVIVYDHYLNKVHLIVLENITPTGAKIAMKKLYEIKELIEDSNLQLESLSDVVFDGQLESNVDQETFMQQVERAKEYIVEGDIFQVVLSRRVTVDQPTSSFNLYRHLRQVNPSPYLFYLNFSTYQVVGSSPEMLVKLNDDNIQTCPIAGTRKRGEDRQEDERLAEELLHDEKEVAEHVMLVDLGRNDMGKVAKIGSINIKAFKEIKCFSHIIHLVSLIEGKKKSDVDPFEVLKAFLPAGTLTGAPKIRAMQIIEELESDERGIYGGAIGYFGFDSNMDMCIAIRTMIIHDLKVYLQAGAGIVADSCPEKEYEETWNKLKGLLKAIGINEEVIGKEVIK